MKRFLTFFFLCLLLFACNLSGVRFTSNPTPSPTMVVAKFNTSTPTSAETTVSQQHLDASETSTSIPTPSPTVTATETLAPTSTNTPLSEETHTSDPSPTSPPAPSTNTPDPEPVAESNVDFVLRHIRLRTNEENSWDGVLGECGSDHSIYVHVADAQENLLDGILVGDKYGNFEVPTGVDGPGMVRILVWGAAMELAVMGHQDGSRHTSDFTLPLSTVDNEIPLEWLQQAGYCDSPEDCQWRVENNQLCRGHYSYDVIFQRTW